MPHRTGPCNITGTARQSHPSRPTHGLTLGGLSPAIVDYGRYAKLHEAIGGEVGDVTLYVNPERTLSSLEAQLRFLVANGGGLRFNRLDLQQKIIPLFAALGRVEVVGGRMQQQGNTFTGRWLVLLVQLGL